MGEKETDLKNIELKLVELDVKEKREDWKSVMLLTKRGKGSHQEKKMYIYIC